MNKFQPHINPVYPANNLLIFEEWVAQNYKGCNTDRELIPVFFTSYFVNNNYAQDQIAKQELQDYVDSLDRNKKWWCVVQYDDSVVVDFKDLDVLRFEMSKSEDYAKQVVPIPLLCQPHPYIFNTGKKYLANFVGSRTHPLRDKLENLIGQEGYYVSYEQHNIQDYCRIMDESIFTLCPRGYGANSFRIGEALQYGSIPVYISDEFILPEWTNGDPIIIIQSEDAHRIQEILNTIPTKTIVEMQNQLPEYYKDNYTFEGCFNQIIKHLEAECNSRKSE